ncbi:hypothetical protein D2Q93_08415 [Alicyclobacillaceae bacterium I2511]|nr:hypothetical protein D2Q93_08415 [Alicyclobacillaceae bacterium I2511]
MDKMLVGIGTVTLLGYLGTAWLRPSMAAEGLETTVQLFVQSVPWIVVSLFSAGLLAQWLHPPAIARILGQEARLYGILLGALLGTLGTGSRWAMYPIAAELLAAHASTGAVFAFVTTWQLVSLTRLPAEIPFYGGRFTILRAIISVVIAVVGGLLIEQIPQK